MIMDYKSVDVTENICLDMLDSACSSNRNPEIQREVWRIIVSE